MYVPEKGVEIIYNWPNRSFTTAKNSCWEAGYDIAVEFSMEEAYQMIEYSNV